MQKSIYLLAASLGLATVVPAAAYAAETHTPPPYVAGAAAPNDTTDKAEETVTPADQTLLNRCRRKTAQYKLQNPADSTLGAELHTELYVPTDSALLPGFTEVANRAVLGLINDSAAQAQWLTTPADSLADRYWDWFEAAYRAERAQYPVMGYSADLYVAPYWQWSGNGGLTTYHVETYTYFGGAHGTSQSYYLTVRTSDNHLLGWADLFKEECLPAVFRLIGEKIQAATKRAADDDMFPAVAEILPEPAAEEDAVRTGQYENYRGHWYMRPALTPDGILLIYPAYVKTAYAEGPLPISLSHAEIKDWLRAAF